ncbi:hypothetical protein DUNSADRAFT_2446 [Dunaliella salina]|uniref:Uncharacterized protein n=1 Tax=Dunaliella salina TaxID=3046 RepID=A0ABQ7FWA1_DUNSA|nr:hypothetical protein DUNSADRAFT_2446 [Dunaliella salina]|eukprot:KAF5826655.1 hypothetical protein DUNSADRAFT_2446 [Dunaliella salina]
MEGLPHKDLVAAAAEKARAVGLSLPAIYGLDPFAGEALVRDSIRDAFQAAGAPTDWLSGLSHKELVAVVPEKAQAADMSLPAIYGMDPSLGGEAHTRTLICRAFEDAGVATDWMDGLPHMYLMAVAAEKRGRRRSWQAFTLPGRCTRKSRLQHRKALQTTNQDSKQIMSLPEPGGSPTARSKTLSIAEFRKSAFHRRWTDLSNNALFKETRLQGNRKLLEERARSLCERLNAIGQKKGVKRAQQIVKVLAIIQ